MNSEATYRDLLRYELESRATKNSGYSMRAFAKSLDLDVAHLSRILRGKKQLSMQSGYLIAQRLFTSSRDREYFLHLLALENATTSGRREALAQQLRGNLRTTAASQARWNILALEQFEVISHWYHFAILDLSTIPGFPMTPKEVAAYLGIRVSETRLAMGRLERLGLLVRQADGRLIKTHLKLATPSNVPNPALRSYHKQVLAKATQAIESQSVDRRYFISRTIALKRSQLQELRELVDGFFARVSQALGAEESPDALYQVNAQFFDLKEGKEV